MFYLLIYLFFGPVLMLNVMFWAWVCVCVCSCANGCIVYARNVYVYVLFHPWNIFNGGTRQQTTPRYCVPLHLYMCANAPSPHARTHTHTLPSTYMLNFAKASQGMCTVHILCPLLCNLIHMCDLYFTWLLKWKNFIDVECGIQNHWTRALQWRFVKHLKQLKFYSRFIATVWNFLTHFSNSNKLWL